MAFERCGRWARGPIRAISRPTFVIPNTKKTHNSISGRTIANDKWVTVYYWRRSDTVFLRHDNWSFKQKMIGSSSFFFAEVVNGN